MQLLGFADLDDTHRLPPPPHPCPLTRLVPCFRLPLPVPLPHRSFPAPVCTPPPFLHTRTRVRKCVLFSLISRGFAAGLVSHFLEETNCEFRVLQVNGSGVRCFQTSRRARGRQQLPTELGFMYDTYMKCTGVCRAFGAGYYCSNFYYS